MDPAEDSQATQQATQNVLDPRRLGKQNSGFTDEDIADIVCLLYPISTNATDEVLQIASSHGNNPHITGKDAADNVVSDLYLEDDARQFGRTRGLGDHAIVLKLSSRLKTPQLGFTFGRNGQRCDICFTNDPLRRLSNIHFRIYVNQHGVVMLEDQSTNGTIVDDNLLRKPRAEDKESTKTRRMLESGSTIKIFMHENSEDLIFLVRIPRRSEDSEKAYLKNLGNYLQKLQKYEDVDRTIGPGPGGHVSPCRNQPSVGSAKFQQVNLFPKPRGMQGVIQERGPSLPKEWRGGEKYNRVGVIGKGAFATVYKVASKYDGLPYAAKELDKRKFMKNGVLDQKVENEMKIMQQVQHPNIVQYIEHFDWDVHQFFIVMEYVPEGDLGHLVLDNGSIKEPYVKIMAKQLIDALGYLHEKKITHRDVKPDNILIHSMDPLVVKLTDFGLSKMIDTEQTFLKTFCGTLLYCAPEVYSEYDTYDERGRRVRQQQRKQPDRERYDHAVDVWSLGGVLFYALTAAPPFPVKNGISYTELLNHIMTKPLNTKPLSQRGVSAEGIDFIKRMIDRRPETRATIAELKSHPWLQGSSDSFDEISDDGLEQGASQLSLYDGPQAGIVDPDATEIIEPDPEFSSIDFEADKENYTFGQPQANRLWGEVNNSAIGSSGAIAEDQLNIPMSGSSLGKTETESFRDPEIVDSFESEDLPTPKQKPRKPRDIASSVATSQGNSRSIALNDGSQSLGGAESIMENLNMKSWAHNAKLRADVSDVNTSKRKPAYDTGDESPSGSNPKPSFKRIKSGGDEESFASEVNEIALLASIPQVNRTDSGRLIDNPVHKATFWDAADRQSWHLNYPEMMHRQKEAFDKAAKRRNETFVPGKTPLWNLAMKYFPPQKHKLERLDPVLETRRDDRDVEGDDDWVETSPEPFMAIEADPDSIPDTLPPDSQLQAALQTSLVPPKLVAKIYSTPDSLVQGVSILMTEPALSWGRERDNTVVYKHNELRVPKYAFRILLWRDGYMNSPDEFKPWERSRSGSSATLRDTPEPDSYCFYISTKASHGLRINNNQLPPNQQKDLQAPSKYWMKLHHGDTIVFWGTNNVKNQAKLTFECLWGGSACRRPSDEPPTCVPQPIARKLDSAWTKAEFKVHQDKMMAEANREVQYRMSHRETEQERSSVFERNRAEAVKRAAALRASRQKSPALTSAPPVYGRTIPKFTQNSTPYLRSTE